MKKYFILFALVVVLFSGCKKEENASNDSSQSNKSAEIMEKLAISLSKEIPFQIDLQTQKIEKWQGHIDLINNQSIKSAVIKLTTSPVKITGWFGDTVQGMSPSKGAIYFQNGSETYYGTISFSSRDDVGKAFNNKGLDNCGFDVAVNISELPPGKYDVGFLGESNGSYGKVISGISIEK